jgi:hypothetical protein
MFQGALSTESALTPNVGYHGDVTHALDDFSFPSRGTTAIRVESKLFPHK